MCFHQHATFNCINKKVKVKEVHWQVILKVRNEKRHKISVVGRWVGVGEKGFANVDLIPHYITAGGDSSAPYAFRTMLQELRCTKLTLA